ncbi:hypothetical protein TNIN_160091 [Trichonephila inaurata madagascariensis]|uniref:Uncharacterized protein n=1 Tax=Trichonephila inaurata madagascariensis TaxID=2747483 RepID=A0A8X7BTB2_9ARAC|nr:hypothetical protein TNIN_160091 [Trichonephila inaurata madagascariensis]
MHLALEKNNPLMGNVFVALTGGQTRGYSHWKGGRKSFRWGKKQYPPEMCFHVDTARPLRTSSASVVVKIARIGLLRHMFEQMRCSQCGLESELKEHGILSRPPFTLNN